MTDKEWFCKCLCNSQLRNMKDFDDTAVILISDLLLSIWIESVIHNGKCINLVILLIVKKKKKKKKKKKLNKK